MQSVLLVVGEDFVAETETCCLDYGPSFGKKIPAIFVRSKLEDYLDCNWSACSVFIALQ